MKDRNEQLSVIAACFFPILWEARLKQIGDDYRINKEKYTGELEKIILDLLHFCREKQEEYRDMKYIFISSLRSSIITRTYELQIVCFDERLYEEENPFCCYWTPEFIYRGVNEDMESFKKAALKKVFRLKDYEMDEYRKQYVRYHFSVIQCFLQDVAARLDKREEWKEKGMKIMYGGYMEEMVEIECSKVSGI